MTQLTRSSLQIALATWKALFLREAVTRLAAGRAAWVWLLFEPLAYLIFIMTLFGFVYHKMVGGVDGAMFVVTGLLGFYFARNTFLRSMEAIHANGALFTYRQVKPIDTVLVRAALEGFLNLLSAILILAGASLFHYNVLPDDPLLVMATVFALWLCGLGLGLILSAATKLVAELGKVVNILVTPLYFISGVMIPASTIPQPYRDYLLVNPFLHGLEILRGAYFAHYHPVSEASLAYVYGFALVTVFFGLSLHLRFSRQLVAE
ncbi:ABC transporter permease [Telluria mixta]|uniref:Transport permease protein n=1 Tax=Telluria mixta TaxID=34071 RepID=A0ABT2C2S2_9BURK|nr:ABC transporter permease [Telluria mixta]MCS0630964.1 ABC transporter permease [Telluria mixta]WEM98962.1 ABC transporter permease [Telluria mixta]